MTGIYMDEWKRNGLMRERDHSIRRSALIADSLVCAAHEVGKHMTCSIEVGVVVGTQEPCEVHSREENVRTGSECNPEEGANDVAIRQLVAGCRHLIKDE
jgi:hypothetical protein